MSPDGSVPNLAKVEILELGDAEGEGEAVTEEECKELRTVAGGRNSNPRPIVEEQQGGGGSGAGRVAVEAGFVLGVWVAMAVAVQWAIGIAVF